jgi:L-threonylcarbamoyladenylate synthase
MIHVKAKIISLTDAIQDLNQGKCVGMPTETVYGLAANALSATAVAKIFLLKDRPAFNPLIVHGHCIDALIPYAEFSPLACLIASAFWPGPLTLVLPKREIIPEIVTAGRDTVALRVPNHPLALELLKNLPFPLAAPSANRSGRISPTSAQDVVEEFYNQEIGILDGGRCAIGLESTVLYIPKDPSLSPTILRPGGISRSTIEKFLKTKILTAVSNPPSLMPRSPGMLDSHYAPQKPLYFIAPDLSFSPPPHAAWIGYGPITPKHYMRTWNLSTTGNSLEAAPVLFQALREFDNDSTLHIAIAWQWPQEDLGEAINDRLRRASQKKHLP